MLCLLRLFVIAGALQAAARSPVFVARKPWKSELGLRRWLQLQREHLQEGPLPDKELLLLHGAVATKKTRELRRLPCARSADEKRRKKRCKGSG